MLGPATRPTPQDFGIVAASGGDAVRYVIVFADDPLSATAVRLQRKLALRTGDLLDAVGLPHTRALFAGDTAITGELIDTARGDLWRVGPLVLLVAALVLAAFLRAGGAPSISCCSPRWHRWPHSGSPSRSSRASSAVPS